MKNETPAERATRQSRSEWTPEDQLDAIQEDLRREKGPIVDEFDAMMTKQVGLSWGIQGCVGGAITRAILKTDNPSEFVDRLEAAELLHPDRIDVIREQLEEFKNGRPPSLF